MMLSAHLPSFAVHLKELVILKRNALEVRTPALLML